MIDRSVNASPRVAAQWYSSATVCLRASVPARKTFLVALKNVIVLKLRKSGNVCVYPKLNDNTTAGHLYKQRRGMQECVLGGGGEAQHLDGEVD